MYTAVINGISIEIKETNGLFSPLHADRGTLAMLRNANILPGMKVLDLGCGCGIVGIYAAKLLGQDNVICCDIDENAVNATVSNGLANGVTLTAVVSDGVKNVDAAGFDIIFSNPPYQSDFAVAKSFIEKGFNRIRVGGFMYMVTKRRPWYENKLKSVFGGCRVIEDDGYFVFIAEKRSASYARANRK